MADLDNLSDVDDIMNNDNDGLLTHDNGGEELGDATNDADDAAATSGSSSAGIPAALAAAAATRRQLEQQQQEDAEDEFGAADDGQGGYHSNDDNPGQQHDEDEEGEFDDDDNDNPNNHQLLHPEYERLRALWTSELISPELLPHDEDTVSFTCEELQKQEELIEELLVRSKSQQSQNPRGRDGTGGAGGGGAGGGAAAGALSGELASLVAQMTKMDLDRTRFMMVDLARTRMAKIENHALYNRTLLDRMTEEETMYLRQYGELLEKHYQRTVLSHLPKEAYKKLDDPEMIDTPDLERFVFCRVLETCQMDVSGKDGAIQVLNADLEEEEEEEEEEFGGENVQEQQAGSYLICMYKTIRELVLDGKVELLM
eukprot:CAMPEP_0183722092 /NCGR_PEP_ID=MMETSP0737-20130205/14158_1 /TAXON_ID=385413 /ORGANISM="Thalassiosira miniscula, Strain CCMP1093" /LENGTH=370 /DNA_ID=CAMNT_0025952193 /DNA_START=107 /DNA_END=1220 /DNA_ORIENTATION=+